MTGIIDDWTAEDFRWMLMNSDETEIDVYISTYGGSVNAGFEIANLIQAVQNKKISTFNLSHIDSIGTVIFLSAKSENRHIVDNSTMFKHEPRFIIFDEITKDDAEKMAAELEIQKNRIADYYVKNIEGLTKDEAFELMENETNLTAEDMLEHNIVTEIMPAFEIAAQKNLIINQNEKQMFNKKKPINALAMQDGSTLLYEGELEKGTVMQKAGELVNLEGENIDAEGNTVVIDKDNKVEEIVEASAEPTVEPVVESTENIVEEVATLIDEKLTALESKLDAKIEAIRKVGSTHKVTKVVDTKAELSAKGTIKEALDKIQAKKQIK